MSEANYYDFYHGISRADYLSLRKDKLDPYLSTATYEVSSTKTYPRFAEMIHKQLDIRIRGNIMLTDAIPTIPKGFETDWKFTEALDTVFFSIIRCQLRDFDLMSLCFKLRGSGFNAGRRASMKQMFEVFTPFFDDEGKIS